MNPIQLEEAYKDFTDNLQQWAPDGCIHVNLQLLQDLGLLNNWDAEPSSPESLTQQFHVIETNDKVTLFNEKFAVWITPQIQTELPSTLVFIALIQNLKPHLEIVYTTSGVYNTPKYILKVLQHFMTEMLDTEDALSHIEKKKE
ncbi:MAG: hypothetical protein JSS09_06495 [Verrucomicrobia bacterium]|nr:hypothetical protein [Verrucomicrobiota bacterium]